MTVLLLLSREEGDATYSQRIERKMYRIFCSMSY